MSEVLLGALTAGFAIAAVFFLRFWRDTGDRLFVIFAAAFLVEGLSRLVLALSLDPNEGRPLVFGMRLMAYLLILAAIVDKNLARR